MEPPSDAFTSTPKDLDWVWQTIKDVLKRRFRVLTLVREAYAKLSRHDNALKQVRHDLRTLLRFARAWAEGKYRNVPWRAVIYGMGAIIYLVSPVDAIPDVLPGIGFVDDVAVVTGAVRALRDELDDFRAWEASQQTARAETDPAPTEIVAEEPASGA